MVSLVFAVVARGAALVISNLTAPCHSASCFNFQDNYYIYNVDLHDSALKVIKPPGVPVRAENDSLDERNVELWIKDW